MLAGVLVVMIGFGPSPAPQSHRDPGCSEWHECRTMALAAAEQGEFERFHDLAWRAVQTGPPREPALLLLLARAQVLSGRPHDALVMLDRLAAMGIWSDAATNDVFARTRELPGWPDVAARLERLRPANALASPSSSLTPAPTPSPTVTPSPSPSPTPPGPAATRTPSPAPTPTLSPTPAPTSNPSPGPSSSPSPTPVPTPMEEAVRFSTPRISVVGLAYDGVSRRFVFGDRIGRKLVVVSEGSNHALDLVRADAAGFHDISAIDIDSARGDLWVASGDLSDGSGTLHRLQLVSGRPLKSYRIAQGAGSVNPVDVSVTRAGTVLVLDANGRIFALRRGATSLERIAHTNVTDAASLAVGGDEAFAYVAHHDGIARVDLRTGKSTPLGAPKAVSLGGLRRIVWHRTALVALAGEGASTRITRLALNASGRAVARVTSIEPETATAGDTSMTIAGDDLFFLAPAGGSEFVAYRVRLR
jgi:hypothetical protein